MTHDYVYKCKIIRCVDGDTVDAEVDLGFYTFQRIRFRLAGIDTPERGKKGFHEATEYLEFLLLDKEVTVASSKTGKFGRWLGTFYVGELNVNEEMLKTGHAVRYKK